MIRMYPVLLAALLAISGCGTINTVFRPDAVASQNLKESRSYCENIPRIYSGVIYGFCTLNAEPAPEKSLNDRALSDHENNAFPIIAIEFIGPVTALARVQCSILPKHFTDLLTLLFVDGHWQVISKVFHFELASASANG